MQGIRFDPTQEQRRLVHAMAGFGIPHDGIATHLDIDPKTLRLHFRRELNRGAVDATAKVAQSLFSMATTGKNVAAAIFWMKARASWREKHDVTVNMKPLSELSDADLHHIIHGLTGQVDIDAEEQCPPLVDQSVRPERA